MPGDLTPEQQVALRGYYVHHFPGVSIVLPSEMGGKKPLILSSRARFHSYLVKNSRRICPASARGRAHNGLVFVNVPQFLASPNTRPRRVAEVLSIFTHRQAGIAHDQHLVYVRWLKPLDKDIIDHWAN